MTLIFQGASAFRFPRVQLAVACVAVAALASAASPAKADLVNLVQNGNFNDTTATTTYNGVQVGTETTDSNLAAWQFTGCNASNCGFSFLANSNLGSTGWYDQQDGHISTPGTNPGALPVAGSNAFMSDATYGTQYMYQSIAGLRVGDSYTLKFWQASFEQSGYTGGFTSSWQAGLGNGSTFNVANYGVQNSSTMTVASGGAAGWTQQTLSFVANSTSELLAFFATASSGAQPPFLLLDGVSLTDATNPVNVPEPATMTLSAAGVLGLVAARRRRHAR